MKKLIFILLLITPVLAQERVDLTVPETVSNPSYTVRKVDLDYETGNLSIQLKGSNNEDVRCAYTTITSPTGSFLLVNLQKANLASAYAGNATTGTLNQRIFHRLVVLGESTQVCGKTLTGTITGTVQ